MTADDRARRTARFPEAAAARTADAAARARRAITRLHATGQPITSSRWPAPREYRPVFCISTPNFGAKSASTVSRTRPCRRRLLETALRPNTIRDAILLTDCLLTRSGTAS